MNRHSKKPYWWAITYGTLLTSFSVYVVLDTFIIPKSQQIVQDSVFSSNAENTTQLDTSSTTINDTAQTDAIQETSQIVDTSSTTGTYTENSYTDNNISITITETYEYDTQVYIADIQVSSAEYLKTALAENSYGRNIKQTTSDIAEEHNSIFAINGDYYGFRDYGFVVRNGTLYRDTASDGDALVIYNDGSLDTVVESSTNTTDLVSNGAYQVLSFGPTLIKDSQLTVGVNDEVSQSKNSNPRTAIGMISPLHYIVVVSDGRTNESVGLSLYELATIMQEQGCTIAYNLDGGGSSTMWFNGEVVNNPTDGHSNGERKVSDIVYIGY